LLAHRGSPGFKTDTSIVRPKPSAEQHEFGKDGGLTDVDVLGRRLTFQARAIDDSGQLVATDEIDQAIVDREQFLGR
jgi:hypothetical protein